MMSLCVSRCLTVSESSVTSDKRVWDVTEILEISSDPVQTMNLTWQRVLIILTVPTLSNYFTSHPNIRAKIIISSCFIIHDSEVRRK